MSGVSRRPKVPVSTGHEYDFKKKLVNKVDVVLSTIGLKGINEETKTSFYFNDMLVHTTTHGDIGEQTTWLKPTLNSLINHKLDLTRPYSVLNRSVLYKNRKFLVSMLRPDLGEVQITDQISFDVLIVDFLDEDLIW